ncbi:MAG: Tim44 domain-containing protein [Magnetococcales bacterium]|nr:Tim44 domain-containing protein [Magnetococcales bacterium]
MKINRIFALFAITLTLGFAALSVIPDEAEARRFGGGSSFGSRSSRSFSTPRQATSRSTMNQTKPSTNQAAPATGIPGRSGLGSGLMGGIGGLLMGGLIGSMLFGGGSGAGAGGGGGIGFLEIILIGGGIWLFLRWRKQKKAQEHGSMASISSTAYGNTINQGPMDFSTIDHQNEPSNTFERGGGHGFGDNQPLDEVSQGLQNIMQMDPNFQEEHFLSGAKMAFEQIQGAWSDWSVERLRPIMSERIWPMVEAQAAERKAEGRRDIIEKIHFNQAEISEAWQESGENWITVRFQVSMLEYATDVEGNLVEGSRDIPVEVEEYWTFTKPVSSQDPNWFLAAIQQPGEVARSIS